MKIRHSLPIVLALLGAVTAAPAAESNSVLIIVRNGPFAGTYKPDPALILCMRVKSRDRLGMGLKNFGAKGKELAEASIEVARPDDPKQKLGSVHVVFGEGKMAVYDISMQPITLDRKGNGGVMKLEGKTKDGITLRVEATCNDVTSL